MRRQTRVRFITLALATFVLLPPTTGRAADPAADIAGHAVLPADQYTSAKARRLAATHAAVLRGLSLQLHHCLPWLDVHRHSIGFFKPKHVAVDDRYLSVRVFVEQDISPAFARMGPEQRAAAMFSRYAGPLLRRMGGDRRLLADPELGGLTAIVEWVKPDARRDGRRVHETIAVFVETPVAAQYTVGRIGAAELARRARVFAFDGETALGEVALAAWDDDFVDVHRVAGAAPAAGVDCGLRG